MTKIFPIRLLPSEQQMLAMILAGENCVQENGGELFRLWLHREWNKRNGYGQPEPEDYQSAHRGGSKYWLRRLEDKLQLRVTSAIALRNTPSSSISISDGHTASPVTTGDSATVGSRSVRRVSLSPLPSHAGRKRILTSMRNKKRKGKR